MMTTGRAPTAPCGANSSTATIAPDRSIVAVNGGATTKGPATAGSAVPPETLPDDNEPALLLAGVTEELCSIKLAEEAPICDDALPAPDEEEPSTGVEDAPAVQAALRTMAAKARRLQWVMAPGWMTDPPPLDTRFLGVRAWIASPPGRHRADLLLAEDGLVGLVHTAVTSGRGTTGGRAARAGAVRVGNAAAAIADVLGVVIPGRIAEPPATCR